MANQFCFLSETTVVHILAFVGGFVDAAGYYKLHGVFTSSVTGNLVAVAASLHSIDGVLCRGLTTLSFAFSGAVGVAIGLRLRLQHRMSTTAVSICLFILEILLLLASLVVGVVFEGRISESSTSDAPIVVLSACLLGSSMGFHNVAAKECIPNCPPTTVMTSTLITISSNGASALGYLLALLSSKELIRCDLESSNPLVLKYNEFSNKFLVTVKPLLLFLVGALVGSSSIKFGNFWALFIPIAFVSLLCFDLAMKISPAAAVAGKTLETVPTDEPKPQGELDELDLKDKDLLGELLLELPVQSYVTDATAESKRGEDDVEMVVLESCPRDHNIGEDTDELLSKSQSGMYMARENSDFCFAESLPQQQ